MLRLIRIAGPKLDAVTLASTLRVCTRTGSRVFERSATTTRPTSSGSDSVRPGTSRVSAGRPLRSVSVASAAGRAKRAETFATQARSDGPFTATTSWMFVPGAETRARATAVSTYAVATDDGSSSRRARSTTTVSGRAKAARTVEAASARSSPPTRTPAIRTPVGRDPGTAVVVVPVVVGATVVVSVSVVVVPLSAITVPENVPAVAKPATNRPTATDRFTARSV